MNDSSNGRLDLDRSGMDMAFGFLFYQTRVRTRCVRAVLWRELRVDFTSPGTSVLVVYSARSKVWLHAFRLIWIQLVEISASSTHPRDEDICGHFFTAQEVWCNRYSILKGLHRGVSKCVTMPRR
jgi:hypothetical protein